MDSLCFGHTALPVSSQGKKGATAQGREPSQSAVPLVMLPSPAVGGHFEILRWIWLKRDASRTSVSNSRLIATLCDMHAVAKVFPYPCLFAKGIKKILQ